MNADELLEMDPYEEVAQQGQAPPLSPAYVPDPMELDEYVLVYVPAPEHPKHHVPSDDDMQSMEEDSIDYPDEPEDDDEDPKEDPEEDHTDYHPDGGDGDDEPSGDDDDDDTDDEDRESSEDEGDDEEEEEHLASADPSAVPVVDLVPSAEDTEAFETDESTPTPKSPQIMIPFSQTRLRKARKTVKLEPPMSASMEVHIVEHVVAPIPPISPAYDQAPLGHRATMIRMRDDIPKEDMPRNRTRKYLNQCYYKVTHSQMGNKSDLDKISIDDLYNNFEIIEQEVKRNAGPSSSSGSQNMAFVSTPSTSNNDDVSTVFGVSNASPE
nr:hypothetical protein [Tanacetum cinerariifolium]GFA46860.1 hypothetical protein [Tanacetum cinerariifolium]